MFADETTTAEVRATLLDRYLKGYVQRDLDLLMSSFAPEADSTILGTGDDERMVGYETIRNRIQRDWRQSDEIQWEWEPPVVASAGPVAWTLSETQFSARMGSIRVSFKTRVTAVLELRGDRWLIRQMHLSIPSSGQTEGESFPPPLE